MAYPSSRVSRPLTLATDLDGTFLGGTDSDRQNLYSLIESSRESIRLLFVTGRSFSSVQPLFRQFGLPMPDALICDVGTSVYAPDGSWLCDRLHSAVAQAWGDGHSLVEQALVGVEGLALQSATGPYRRSYFYSAQAAADRACEIVQSLGYDGLISDNKYFDVLPQGINKGSTLRHVIELLGVDPSGVLVAGDTFNDLSMLASGLPAVVVGESETGLREALASLQSVYHASAAGAGGILEALAQHPLLNQG